MSSWVANGINTDGNRLTDFLDCGSDAGLRSSSLLAEAAGRLNLLGPCQKPA